MFAHTHVRNKTYIAGFSNLFRFKAHRINLAFLVYISVAIPHDNFVLFLCKFWIQMFTPTNTRFTCLWIFPVALYICWGRSGKYHGTWFTDTKWGVGSCPITTFGVFSQISVSVSKDLGFYKTNLRDYSINEYTFILFSINIFFSKQLGKFILPTDSYKYSGSAGIGSFTYLDITNQPWYLPWFICWCLIFCVYYNNG